MEDDVPAPPFEVVEPPAPAAAPAVTSAPAAEATEPAAVVEAGAAAEGGNLDGRASEDSLSELPSNLVMFEGELMEVVDDGGDAGPPPEDDEDDDYETLDDNVEEAFEDDMDALTIDEYGEAVDMEAGAGEDHSCATMAGHGDSVYAVAAHRALGSSKVKVVTGGGDDVGTLWHVSVEKPTPEQAAAMAGSGAEGGLPVQPVSASSVAVATLGGHTDSVGAVSFSSDGLLCATGGLDGLVKVWDTETGSLKRTLEGPSDVEWLTWHSKGTVLLCGSSDGTVWMWLATTGACMQVFAGHEGSVTAGLFTPDGRAVVTGGSDATVRLWAPKKGTCRHVFQGHGFHEGGITCLAAHPLFDATGAGAEDAKGSASEYSLVSSGGEDGYAKLMHVGTKKIVASFPHSAGVDTVEAAERGVVSATSGKAAGVSAEALSVEAVALSGVQPWLATAGVDGSAKIWDMTTGRLRSVLNQPRSGAVTKVRWHPDQACLVTASGDGAVRLWDARAAGGASGACVATYRGHGDMVVDLATVFDRGHASGAAGGGGGGGAFMPDLVVTASDDRTAKVYALPSNPLSA